MRNFDHCSTNDIVQAMRDDKPRCLICDKPCDPDVEPIEVIMVPMLDTFDSVGLMPVHGGACSAEAHDRLKRGQEAVAN